MRYILFCPPWANNGLLAHFGIKVGTSISWDGNSNPSDEVWGTGIWKEVENRGIHTKLNNLPSTGQHTLSNLAAS